MLSWMWCIMSTLSRGRESELRWSLAKSERWARIPLGSTALIRGRIHSAGEAWRHRPYISDSWSQSSFRGKMVSVEIHLKIRSTVSAHIFHRNTTLVNRRILAHHTIRRTASSNIGNAHDSLKKVSLDRLMRFGPPPLTPSKIVESAELTRHELSQRLQRRVNRHSLAYSSTHISAYPICRHQILILNMSCQYIGTP